MINTQLQNCMQMPAWPNDFDLPPVAANDMQQNTPVEENQHEQLKIPKLTQDSKDDMISEIATTDEYGSLIIGNELISRNVAEALLGSFYYKVYLFVNIRPHDTIT